MKNSKNNEKNAIFYFFLEFKSLSNEINFDILPHHTVFVAFLAVLSDFSRCRIWGVNFQFWPKIHFFAIAHKNFPVPDIK